MYTTIDWLLLTVSDKWWLGANLDVPGGQQCLSVSMFRIGQDIHHFKRWRFFALCVLLNLNDIIRKKLGLPLEVQTVRSTVPDKDSPGTLGTHRSH